MVVREMLGERARRPMAPTGAGGRRAVPAAEGIGQGAAASAEEARRGAAAASASWLQRHRTGLAVALVGVLATLALALTTSAVAARTEHRLLVTQVRQGALVLQVDAQGIEHPLAATSELGATDPKGVAAYAASLLARHKPFQSLSLWRRAGSAYEPVERFGSRHAVERVTPGIQQLLAASRAHRTLGVLAVPRRRPDLLVYGFVAVAGGGRVAAVATQALPPHRVVRPLKGSPFSDLAYAIYLGRRPRPSELLFRTAAHVPAQGARASATFPFGDVSLTVVAGAVGWLAGGLSQWLPWSLAGAGIVLAGAAALVADRTVGRRLYAERLAGEVARLYGEQRTIAETLQQALLPDAPPAVPGLELAMRYLPGAAGVDVGGDWYDVVPLGAGRVLAVVGDVSGRGIEAARVMASLRHALRAYAAEPGTLVELVTKLDRLLDIDADGHFATLLTVVADVEAHTCRVVNAGHLPPLLVTGSDAGYLETVVGTPIGVHAGSYTETIHAIPPHATLLGFTDGLVERRETGVEPGLEALRLAGAQAGASLEELMGGVFTALAPVGGDDAAILALRWQH